MSSPVETLDSTPETATKDSRSKTSKSTKGPLDYALDFLSSIRVGISLLVLLILASSLGTFIIQKGTSGFREYFQQLLPAERTLYTTLGFLDVYHTWWFNLLLLTVCLNIILASIDYFPAAWHYTRKPMVKISSAFIRRQPWKETLILPEGALTVEQAQKAVAVLMRPSWAVGPLAKLSSVRVRVTTNDRDGSTTVFADRGVWNRLMAYAVHVSLLTIFIGAFIGGQFGRKGLIHMEPGETTSRFTTQSMDESQPDEQFQMPFTLVCTDIKQDLIDPKKADLSPQNTLDWHTVATIKDDEKGKEVNAHIHLNTPFDYRGHRFFQASFDQIGSAREVTITVTPTAGGEAKGYKVGRQPVTLPGIGVARLTNFYPDFGMDGGRVGTVSGEYNKPVAELEVTPPGGQPTTVWALTPLVSQQLAAAPFVQSKTQAAGYSFLMTDFEKVSAAHILQVQYDPGVDAVYIGCAMLIASLWLVFFFSHQRIWVFFESREDGTRQVSIVGHSNRNKPAFEKKFTALTEFIRKLGGETKAEMPTA